jgi:Tfp pilus assembly protein PilE
MVDLMMWLVIAALLLAAALQGIGYYQQAAWTYQAKSDVASVRTYLEARYATSGSYPNIIASDNARLKSSGHDLKLSANNEIVIARVPENANVWSATLLSRPLHEAGKTTKFFNFGNRNDPGTTVDERSNSIPASTEQKQVILGDDG